MIMSDIGQDRLKGAQTRCYRNYDGDLRLQHYWPRLIDSYDQPELEAQAGPWLVTHMPFCFSSLHQCRPVLSIAAAVKGLIGVIPINIPLLQL